MNERRTVQDGQLLESWRQAKARATAASEEFTSAMRELATIERQLAGEPERVGQLGSSVREAPASSDRARHRAMEHGAQAGSRKEEPQQGGL